jgi:hypothetical protein
MGASEEFAKRKRNVGVVLVKNRRMAKGKKTTGTEDGVMNLLISDGRETLQKHVCFTFSVFCFFERFLRDN